MKSKIWIDIDEQNQPVIKVKAELTSDVRDKLLVRFFDELGGDSSTLTVKFLNGIYEGEDRCTSFEAEIYPCKEIEVDIEELLRVENDRQDANEQAREYMNSLNK